MSQTGQKRTHALQQTGEPPAQPHDETSPLDFWLLHTFETPASSVVQNSPQRTRPFKPIRRAAEVHPKRCKYIALGGRSPARAVVLAGTAHLAT